MSSFDFSAYFPGRLLRDIPDREFLDLMAKLAFPRALARERYALFCASDKRAPDWTTFDFKFPKP